MTGKKYTVLAWMMFIVIMFIFCFLDMHISAEMNEMKEALIDLEYAVRHQEFKG